MQFPTLQSPEAFREELDTFLGYNAGTRIAEGEFSDMENLTSDRFPLLSPRKKRGTWGCPENVQGMIAKDSLCYVDGSAFVMDGYRIEMGLSRRPEDCPKQLVSMGAYVVIFPDKKYINTANLTDFGNLEAEFTARGAVRFLPASLTGELQLPDYVQPEEPEEPDNMALWMDTASGTLMQWSAGSAMWVQMAESFIRIEYPGIGAAFSQYDGVTMTGLPEKLEDLEGSNVIWDRDEDFLLVPGLLDRELTVDAALTVSRKLPRMDFVIECGNRLWGCSYGVNAAGAVVNEIYASRLGDFKNWNCFMGLTTDSYAVSLGDDGPFTGAIQHMGYPLFFRENRIHKIYGKYPANFQIQTTPCRGVQRGSEGSLAILGEVLYYKSVHGVCAYDGSLPVEVSRELGTEYYTDAVAGAHGSKYYISMKNAGGEYPLFVYDSVRKLWHKERCAPVRCFCSCREELYFLDGDGAIRTVLGSGEPEEAVEWMAQSGLLGVGASDTKYLSRMSLRLRLAEGSRVRVLVRYDSQPDWEQAAELHGTGLGSFTLPLRVRRCDHLQLRLEGVGDAMLYHLVKTVETGSDVF